MRHHLVILVLLYCSLGITILFPQKSDAGDSYLSDVTKFAEAGDAESQFALALLYEYGGEGVVRNQEQAKIWFEKAGLAEIAGACLYLGIKFENGNGVKQDYQEAVYWYDCAVRQDWPAAHFFLPVCIEKGKECNRAMSWPLLYWV